MKNENIKKCGVYEIRNIINGKLYIGSTTDSFQNRWQCHKKRLRAGKHHSLHLQSAWNKYGENNFVFEIIEVTSPDEALSREGYYIHLYKTLDPKFGYNIQVVAKNGNRTFSDEVRDKIRKTTIEHWRQGLLRGNFKKGIPSWNKGLKCDNISLARRRMFSSVQVFKDDILIATFRSVADLDDWTKENELPGLTYYVDKHKRANKGRRTTHLSSANIQRAIRTNIVYRGLRFKRSKPLHPEMGVVKWENCWKGETPNQQPSQPLTKLEGSETNS